MKCFAKCILYGCITNTSQYYKLTKILTCLLVSWWLCYQPIRNQVWRFFSTNRFLTWTFVITRGLRDRYCYSVWFLCNVFGSVRFFLKCFFQDVTYFKDIGIVSFCQVYAHHYYCDVIMDAIASQITSLTIVYSTGHSGAYQRKHQSSASLALVRGMASKAENVFIWWRHHDVTSIINMPFTMVFCLPQQPRMDTRGHREENYERQGKAFSSTSSLQKEFTILWCFAGGRRHGFRGDWPCFLSSEW